VGPPLPPIGRFSTINRNSSTATWGMSEMLPALPARDNRRAFRSARDAESPDHALDPAQAGSERFRACGLRPRSFRARCNTRTLTTGPVSGAAPILHPRQMRKHCHVVANHDCRSRCCARRRGCSDGSRHRCWPMDVRASLRARPQRCAPTRLS
jgi:hypothetical protein